MATAKENQNPHKAARVAMVLFNREYASQTGGSMDFWENLPEWQKKVCRDVVQKIDAAPVET